MIIKKNKCFSNCNKQWWPHIFCRLIFLVSVEKWFAKGKTTLNAGKWWRKITTFTFLLRIQSAMTMWLKSFSMQWREPSYQLSLEELTIMGLPVLPLTLISMLSTTLRIQNSWLFTYKCWWKIKKNMQNIFGGRTHMSQLMMNMLDVFPPFAICVSSFMKTSKQKFTQTLKTGGTKSLNVIPIMVTADKSFPIKIWWPIKFVCLD